MGDAEDLLVTEEREDELRSEGPVPVIRDLELVALRSEADPPSDCQLTLAT
jgi:hypothetical protein